MTTKFTTEQITEALTKAQIDLGGFVVEGNLAWEGIWDAGEIEVVQTLLANLNAQPTEERHVVHNFADIRKGDELVITALNSGGPVYTRRGVAEELSTSGSTWEAGGLPLVSVAEFGDGSAIERVGPRQVTPDPVVDTVIFIEDHVYPWFAYGPRSYSHPFMSEYKSASEITSWERADGVMEAMSAWNR